MDEETQTTGNPSAPAQADTVDTQNSEASVQTNNETPEATQDNAPAQEAVAPETKAEDTVEEKLYAGKYKSPEEMEKAYKELESKFGKETSEKAELTRLLNAAFSEPATAPLVPQEQPDAYGYEESQAQSQPTQNDKVTQDLAVMKFIMTHQGENLDGASLQKILKDDPYVQNINGPEAKLEYAYLRSQNMARDKAIAEAQQQAAVKTQEKSAEKVAAQVESAGRQAPPTNDNQELSQSELREKLRSDKGFDEVIAKKFPGIKRYSAQQRRRK